MTRKKQQDKLDKIDKDLPPEEVAGEVPPADQPPTPPPDQPETGGDEEPKLQPDGLNEHVWDEVDAAWHAATDEVLEKMAIAETLRKANDAQPLDHSPA